MKHFRLACWSVFALLGVGFVELKTNKEPNYLPANNGEFRAIYLILGPNQAPMGEQNVVVTPFGQFVVNEQPNSMTTAELSRARQIGEDTTHRHMIGLRMPSGKTSYMTYDDREKTRQEAFTDVKDFENFRLNNNRI